MQRQRWYAWPSPPKSKRYVPEIFRDRKIPFNHSGTPPAPPPERGFWAPRPGGEWRRGPRGLRYIPARKLPEGYMDPRKKLAFDKIACTERDAENANGNAQFSRRPTSAPQPLPKQGLQMRGPPPGQPLPKPSQPPQQRPSARGLGGGPQMPGYQHAHHHNGSLMGGGRFGRQQPRGSMQPVGNLMAGRGAPPRPQVQVQHRPRIWAGGVRNESAAPAAVPPHYGRPMVKEAPAKEEKEGLCAIM